jgi:hypothetical protein
MNQLRGPETRFFLGIGRKNSKKARQRIHLANRSQGVRLFLKSCPPAELLSASPDMAKKITFLIPTMKAIQVVLRYGEYYTKNGLGWRQMVEICTFIFTLGYAFDIFI